MAFLVFSATPFADGNNNRYTPDVNGWVSVPDLMAIQPILESGLATLVPVMAIVITTAKRPTVNLLPGMMLFDSTLGKPIWRNAANSGWVDATGTAA